MPGVHCGGGEEVSEPVNQQSHYTALTPEPLDVIEAWERQGAIGHHAACALKYIARHRHHGTPRSDLEKAIDYLRRLIDRDYTAEDSATSALDDTAQMSPNDDGCPMDLPPGWEDAFHDAITLGPRGAPVSTTAKYGRPQTIPDRQYHVTPTGRKVPLCSVPGCANSRHSRGLCKKHGG